MMKPTTINVLLIEDNPGDARLILEYLGGLGGTRFSITHTESLSSGIEKLNAAKIDIVLLDLDLPDSSGLDTLKICNEKAPEVPVIVLTGLPESHLAVDVANCGAQDYLVKGNFDRNLLVRAIQYAIERHRMRFNLQTSEVRFRNIIEESADGIVIVDREGKALFVNPAMLEIFGCQEDDLIGENIGFPIMGSDIAVVDIFRGGGERRTAEFRVSTTQWDDETVYLISLRDVTDRVEAVEELRNSQEMYQTLVETSPDVVLSTDLQLNIRFVSQQAIDLFGYLKVEEITNMNLGEFIISDDRQQLTGSLKLILKTGLLRNIQLNFSRRDGGQFPGEMNVSLVRNTSGEPQALIATIRDISERVRAERLLLSLNQASKEMWIAKSQSEVFQTTGKCFWDLGFTCTIFLLDDSGEKISPAYLNIDPNLVAAAEKLVNIRYQNFYFEYKKISAFEKVIDLKETIILEDVIGIAKQMVPRPFRGIAEKIVKILMVPKAINAPLVVDDAVVGMLSVQSDDLSYLDSPAITAFANQLAMALSQAKLIEQAQNEIAERKIAQTTLQKKLDEISTLNALASAGAEETSEESLIQRAVKAIRDFFKVQNTGIMLLDEKRNVLQLHRVKEGGVEEEDLFAISAGKGIAGKVARSGKAVCLGDVSDDKDYFAWNSSTRSELCVPIKVDQKILGVINIESPELNAFHKSDEELLSMLASQLGTAIEKIRSFGEASHKSRELQALYDISLAISEELDPNRLLLRLYEQIDGYLSPEVFGVALYDAFTNEICLEFAMEEGEPLGEWIGKRWPLEQGGLTGWVIENQKSLYLPNLQEKESVPVEPKHAGEPVATWLGVPLIVHERIIGALTVQSFRVDAFDEYHRQFMDSLAVQVAITLENARLYEGARLSASKFEGLFYTAGELAGHKDLSLLLDAIMERATLLLNISHGGIFLYDELSGDLEFKIAKDLAVSIGSRLKIGEGLAGKVAESREPMSVEHYTSWEFRSKQFDGIQITSVLEVPMLYAGKLIGVVLVCDLEPDQRVFTDEDIQLFSLFANQAAGAVHSARLFEQINRRLLELETVNKLSSTLREASTVGEMLPILLEETIGIMGARMGGVYLLEEETDELVVHDWYPYNPDLIGLRIHFGEGIVGNVAELGEIYITDDLLNDEKATLFPEEQQYAQDIKTTITLPLETQHEIVGVLYVAMGENYSFSENEISLLTSISNMAANAIHRASLNEQTLRSFEKLSTLRDIDRAITASLDLKVTLNLCIEQIIGQLDVDAAAVLRFNPNLQILEYTTGKGFRTQLILGSKVRMGMGYAGQAVLEQRTIAIEDIYQDQHQPDRFELFTSESFIGYCVVPLVAKGEVKGVLEVYKKTALRYDSEWLEYLETLAEQAAIAIDNTSLFEKAQRSNLELVMAYDQTIEGWSRALELRLLETKGHGKRVTDLAVQLSRYLNFKDEDLVHIRRGALLHDIGKMGIPDDLLRKKGGLSEDEWGIIRQHPGNAYNLLYPISFLRPALDIPYYHHERWDGSGYPFGMKGEQIPIAARLFAVVDVWDALSTDQPYRERWPEKMVWGYLHENSGILFDPEIVEAFMNLMGVKSESLNYDQDALSELVTTIGRD